ncbi:MAG: methylmalonyl-CoA epimerase [Gemmatimonadales bacterium]
MTDIPGPLPSPPPPPPPPLFPRIAHVGIAVPSVAQALAFYRDVLGLTPRAPESADGASIVSLGLGDVDVELLEPRDPNGPVARFLAKRGPGIHHICYRVADLDRALERCRAAGYRLVDETPRRGAGGRRIAFVHPKATAGILLELTE